MLVPISKADEVLILNIEVEMKFFYAASFAIIVLTCSSANAWDIEKYRDVHKYECGDFWDIAKESSGKNQISSDEIESTKNIATSVVDELYNQDAMWVSSGHKSYLEEIPRKAIPKLWIKIIYQCKKNPSRIMVDQVHESFLEFAKSHWNPFADPDFNPRELDEE